MAKYKIGNLDLLKDNRLDDKVLDFIVDTAVIATEDIKRPVKKIVRFLDPEVFDKVAEVIPSEDGEKIIHGNITLYRKGIERETKWRN